MANPAAIGGGNAPATSAQARPFWASSNYYLQKNNDQINNGANLLLSSSKPNFNLRVDAGGFLRGVRIQVRSAGGVGGTASADNPWNLFQNLIFSDAGNAQIFNSTNGYESMLYNAYGRPWEGDPTQAYDYAQSINPSFTLKLYPEIRHTLGALSNTDPRSQYRIQGNVSASTDLVSGSISTATTITTTMFQDVWAQPDAVDLQKIPNEQAPVGAFAARSLRRNQSNALNGAGSNNTFQFTDGVGNLLRNVFFVVRDSNGARQDYLSDPIEYRTDARVRGYYTPDAVQSYMETFYGTTGTLRRPQGVYVFPQFWNPGSMTGQGWLETSNATLLQLKSSTLGTAVNTSGGTINAFSDEVIPLEEIPMELEDL